MPGSYYRLCVYVHSMSKLIPKGMKMKKGHLYQYLLFLFQSLNQKYHISTKTNRVYDITDRKVIFFWVIFLGNNCMLTFNFVCVR